MTVKRYNRLRADGIAAQVQGRGKEPAACRSRADENKDQRMLSLFVDVGMEMLQNGAEIWRAEETIERMGYAYGAARMDIFSVTNYLAATMTMQDYGEQTVTRRVVISGNNFERVEELNALSRDYCRRPFDMEELADRIDSIRDKKVNIYKAYIGSLLVGSMFTVFFGGNALDGVVSGLCALLICFMQRNLKSLCSSNEFFYFLSSLIMGFLIGFIHLFLPINTAMVIIGDIMLLIPGLMMMNAIKDIFLDDTLSGIMRLTESLFWTGGIACGFIIPIFIMGM